MRPDRAGDGAVSVDPVQLRLEIARDAGGCNRIAGRRVRWPWSLPRGFHQHGLQGPLTVLPQCAAAGILPGDDWRHEIALGAQAGLRLIEAGATVVHGGGVMPGRVSWSIDASPGARLCLFAQPYVLMPGARLTQEIHLDLHENACVVLCDGLCLSGRADPAQAWDSTLTVSRHGGACLLRDAQRVDGVGFGRLARVCDAAGAFGSVTILAPGPVLAPLGPALDAALGGMPGTYTASGALRGGAGLALRLACRNGGTLVRALAAAQGILEQRLLQ